MAVKANWFADVPVSSADPFAKTEQLELVGKPIDLDGPVALNERLIELVNAEAALSSTGVECSIKDSADSTCLACPVRSRDPAQPLTALCRVGCQQERVLTHLAVLRVRDDPQP